MRSSLASTQWLLVGALLLAGTAGCGQLVDMIGGVFWQHPWGPKHTVTVKVEDIDHALVKGAFEKNEFLFKDEIYEFREQPYDRTRLRVLLSLNLEKSDKPYRPLRRKDGDYPVAWVRSHGKGRVFYCSLGRAPSTYADPAILKFWLRGIQFAAGDLEASTEQSKQSSRRGYSAR